MLKSGNLMGGAPKAAPPLNTDDKALFMQACISFGLGQVAEALIHFASLAEGRAHPALLFNLAACHCKAQDCAGALAEAQNCLEKALTLLPPAAPLPAPAITQGATFKALAAQEAKSSAYTAPMSLELAEKMPQAARLGVLRLLIDVCAASGQWQQVIKLASGLGGAGYGNVNAALALARSNSGEIA